MIRILHIENIKDFNTILKEIGVDPYGIEIMSKKAFSYAIRIKSLSWVGANILKQEALSVGADLALPRDVLIGKLKKTDCILIGNLKQFEILKEKILLQPFELKKLSFELDTILQNYHQADQFVWDLGKKKFHLKERSVIMGIINLTPDSFSGDGLYKENLTYEKYLDSVISVADEMINNGADIIDIGGESSRPGAKAISLEEELERTIPIIRELVKRVKVPISVDTYKPEVAEEALKNGANIINDITGLRNKRMREIVRKYKAGVIIMHMKGKPLTMQKNPHYRYLIDEILDFFKKSIKKALEAGIEKSKIVIDPGIGFGKTLEHNLTILKHLNEFKILGFPIMLGVSRKSFIGKILNIDDPQKRIFGTISSVLMGIKNGAKIFRVHDVKEVKQAISLWEKIQAAS